MTSSPGSSSAIMGKNMIGLPPGTTQTCSGPTWMPRVSRDVGRDRLRAAREALRRPIMRPPVVERLLGRFDDVRRA